MLYKELWQKCCFCTTIIQYFKDGGLIIATDIKDVYFDYKVAHFHKKFNFIAVRGNI